MKLSKIYSNSSIFKKIEFNDGLNLIVGKIKEENIDKDTHNLGKTSLVHLIDFLLLKELRKDDIFKTHFELFKEHIFFLEILLNDNNYLTIKRSVEKQTKISFKLSRTKILANTQEFVWDHKEIPLKKAKNILNDYLKFDVLKQYDYRKFLSFF